MKKKIIKIFLDAEHAIKGPPLKPNNDPKITEHEPESANNLNPVYPTIDGKPPKTPQEKPHKKPSKTDQKYQTHFTQSPPIVHETQTPDYTDQNNKFDFSNYDEDIAHHLNVAAGPGPGFFNPSASKDHHYPDYGLYSNQQPPQQPPHNGRPQQQPGAGAQKPKPPYGGQFNGQELVVHHTAPGHDKLPPELLNIIGGGNGQNPHIRIEQLLQHIQGASPVPNAGPLVHGGTIQIPFGHGPPPQNAVNYQFGDHRAELTGLQQRPQTGGLSHSICFFTFFFCMSLFLYLFCEVMWWTGILIIFDALWLFSQFVLLMMYFGI